MSVLAAHTVLAADTANKCAPGLPAGFCHHHEVTGCVGGNGLFCFGWAADNFDRYVGPFFRHLEIVAYRTGFDKTIQLYAKWDVLHQHASMPVSVSPILSIDGSNNFQDRYAPSIGATISRQIDDVAAVYVVPMWTNNVAPLLNQFLGLKQNTFYVGLGGRLRIRPTVYVSAEISPRVAGYAPNTAEYGFAIEKRAGAHVFQLNFTNSSLTTFAQTAQGGQVGDLQMGFNLTRKFF